MSTAEKFNPHIEPEVEALSDYMMSNGLDPQGAEGHLVSCSLRWFTGELGIAGSGELAAPLRKAFVNQALYMLANYGKLREKFADADEPNLEAEVSEMETDTKTNGFTKEQAAKARFVEDMNDALIRNGEGRYSYLEETPLTYTVDGFNEYVTFGNRRANVTGDSLMAIMYDVCAQIF